MASLEGRRALYTALAANLIVFVVKFAVAIASHSAAVFSEALHTLADSTNSVFLLLGFYLSEKPADREHPFGYGMESYFWTFLACIFTLGVTCAGSLYRGTLQVIYPAPVENFTLSIGTLILVFIVETLAVFSAVTAIMHESGAKRRQAGNWLKVRGFFQSSHSPAVKFVFFEDSLAAIGVLIAILSLVLVRITGETRLDGVASIMIAIIIGYIAVRLANENRESIIGRKAHDPVEEEIGDAAMSVPDVEDIHEIKTLHVGPRAIIVNMEIEVDPDIEVEDADDIAAEVERRIKEAVPEVTHVSIELLADDDLQTWE